MPKIIIEETPASILSRAGSQVWGAREDMKEAARRQAAFELDKQRAEFDLATERQEQARKIESEQAYRDGIQFGIKHAGAFDSPLQQQAAAIEAANADPSQEGYRRKGAQRLLTAAETEFAEHERQKKAEGEAIAVRMHNPDHARRFIQDIFMPEMVEERMLFEGNKLVGNLEQFQKNMVAVGGMQGDELQPLIDTVKTAMPLAGANPELFAKTLQDATNAMLTAQRAYQKNYATGNFKAQQGMQMQANLDRLAAYNSSALTAAATNEKSWFDTTPHHDPEDAARDAHQVYERMNRAEARYLAEQRAAQNRKDDAAKPPGSLLEEIREDAAAEGMKRVAASLLPPEGLDAWVRDRTRDGYIARRGTDEFVTKWYEGQVRESFGMGPWPPKGAGPGKGPGAGRRAAQEQQKKLGPIPATKYNLSEITKSDPGREARVYHMLAQLMLEGKTSAEARRLVAGKLKVAIDAIDPQKLNDAQLAIQEGSVGKADDRLREMGDLEGKAAMEKVLGSK